jgi:hypothetical protein
MFCGLEKIGLIILTLIFLSKIPGAPIMSVARGKYVIERLPDAPEK